MERESTLARVYGPNGEAIEASFARAFQNQETVLSDLGINASELEKTSEEKEIISLVNFHFNRLLTQVGVQELTIPDENIHMLPFCYNLIVNGMELEGLASHVHQAIVMNRSISNLGTAHIMFHEMIHLQSHSAMRTDGIYFDVHRSGLTSTKNGQESFRNLNEAVTEELTREFMLRYQNHPLFRSDIERVKTMVDDSTQKFDPYDPTSQDLAVNGLLFPYSEGENEIILQGFGLSVERAALNKLIDRLHYFNSDRFKTRKQVFNKFVNGLFTGHIYELGKLIDTTFGRGTFKTLGKIQDPEELLGFVNSLQ